MSKRDKRDGSWTGGSAPLSDVAELSVPFRIAEKPESEFGLGLELEFFALNKETLTAAHFEGAQGIERILNELANRFGWQKVIEGKHTIGLKCDDSPSSITLEPSGAIELVMPPMSSLTEISEEVRRRISQVVQVTEPLGLALAGMGLLPFDTIESAGLVPKERYSYMYDYMPKVGELGREMMKLTASLQVSIDYSSEQDAMRKLQLASKLSPVFTALSADSSVYQGKFSGFASRRSWIWAHTDNARTGVPEFVWNDSATFDDYVSWALDVPMYFLMREGERQSVNGMTFREFLKQDKHTPTQADWELHLSTLFPNARLRRYVEIRTFDQSCPVFACALTTLVKALFYSEEGLLLMEQLASRFTPENFEDALHESARSGLDGQQVGTSYRDMAMTLLEFSLKSPALDPGEYQFLKRLQEKVRHWSLSAEKQLIEQSSFDYVQRRLISGAAGASCSAATQNL